MTLLLRFEGLLFNLSKFRHSRVASGGESVVPYVLSVLIKGIPDARCHSRNAETARGGPKPRPDGPAASEFVRNVYVYAAHD